MWHHMNPVCIVVCFGFFYDDVVTALKNAAAAEFFGRFNIEVEGNL